MAIKLDYVARETVTNLKRNLTLTLASMVTVAVSLALVGSAFVVRAARAALDRALEGRRAVHRVHEPRRAPGADLGGA